MVENMTPEQAEAFGATSSLMANAVSQAVSPCTATTGERARALLAQMKAGKEIISRRMAANGAGSTTESMALGPDFIATLAECGR